MTAMSNPAVQVSRVPNNLRFRRTFGRIKKIIEIPNLIDIQKRSYDEFLQRDVAPERAQGHRAAGGLQVGLPDQGLQRDRVARVRQLHARRAQVRRRRVPPARHDLRRAAQGHDPAGHLGRRSRERRALDQERQGAGGLLRRDPADDRATAPSWSTAPSGSSCRSCIARPACSSTTTRARPTPAASCSTRRASSRTAARGSTSSSTRATSSSCASTGGGSSTPRCCCARSA